MLRGVRLGVTAAAMLLLCASCDRDVVAGPPSNTDPPRATPSQSPRAEAERSPLHEGIVLGEFSLSKNPVVDGDTIRVEGFDRSVRMLGIDTEEKIRNTGDKKTIEEDFARYLRIQRRDSLRPVKSPTPMGDEATAFANAFFDGADVVRLERDDPKLMRGRFGRPLAYVFVRKDGKWTSYSVEAVRAGMSPYFTKYGYSHRFHSQFARAEAEARGAKRGIWDPDKKHYDDYAERKAWWNARADFIQAFEHSGASRNDHVLLARFDAMDVLEARIGKETTVLGNVEEIQRFKGLVRVFFSGADRRDFPIIFRDYGVFQRTGIARASGEPVSVRGVVERYTKGKYDTLQIVVTKPSQVTVPTELARDGETRRSHGR